jgi:hypothetical protein
MDADTLQHLVSTFFVWAYKIATLILGYLFAKLGHDLFLRGVKGEFKFHAEMKGVKADLASASPGLFFILMGTVIVAVGLYKGLSIETLPATTPAREMAVEQPLPSDTEKPALRRTLPESSSDNGGSKQ